VDGFDPLTSFGPDVSRRYDKHLRGDEAETVEFLAELAKGGPALEFAIGTGRIALPLAARGVRVDGIEQSPDMVARLREKPGGESVDVTMGDMASVDASGRYPLVYLVFNTIYNLLTQDAQVRCFENAARHLTDAGVRLGPISCRLIWPSEMDLMARIAGLKLVDRWGGWNRAPFTGASERHISVYSR
jgi:hypothetical protein